MMVCLISVMGDLSACCLPKVTMRKHRIASPLLLVFGFNICGLELFLHSGSVALRHILTNALEMLSHRASLLSPWDWGGGGLKWGFPKSRSQGQAPPLCLKKFHNLALDA